MTRILLVLLLGFAVAVTSVEAAKKKRDRREEGEDEAPSSELDISREIDLVIEEYYQSEEDYHSASEKLLFLAKNAKKKRDSAKAYYYVGRSLLKLGLVYSAIPFLIKAISSDNRHYTPLALKGLFRISEYLKEDKFLHSAMEELDYDYLPTESRAEVNYYLGKSYFGDELYEKAMRKFQKVIAGSHFFSASLYFRGLIYYKDGNLQKAAEFFKEILDLEGAEGTLVYDLAALALGRLYYELQAFSRAITAYRLVTKWSSVWHEALFESSWAYFMAGNPQKALGNLHSVHSPFFDRYFNPESYLLKAIIFYSFCWYGDADKSVTDFLQRYTTLSAYISKLQEVYEQADPQQVFLSLSKKAQSGDQKDEYYKMIFNFILTEKTFSKTVHQIDVLERELQADTTAPDFWQREFFPPIKQQLMKRREAKEKAAGFFVRDFLKKDAMDLKNQINQAQIIQLEIKSSEMTRLEEKLRQLGQKTVEKKVKEKDILIDVGFEFWPFTGEYWKDEVGYYIYNIVNICAKQQ